jgi:hypothetical protein
VRRSADRLARAAGVILPPLALVVAAGLYFREILPLPEAQRYFGGDFASYFYPVYRYVAEEIGAGRLPHWAPYVGVGYPLLSDIEASVFYPPIRLMTLFTGPPSYLALELYAIAHFVLTGLGMLLLGRTLGLPVVPASVAALTFMFSGFFWAHSSHLTIVQAATWAPWLLAAHARALATGSVAWTVGAGVLCALMLLGGHPQIALYVGLALGLFCVVATKDAWPRTSRRRRLTMAATTAAVVGLGLALAAPQLMPTLALAPSTSRWRPSADFLQVDTLEVDQLFTFLVPLAYFGTERFHSVDEFYAYVGIGALVLASAALVLQRGLWSRYFGLLMLAGLALALAPAIPVFRKAAPYLPLVGLFRASARATLLTDLGAAALAGIGLQAWTRTLAARGDGRGVRALTWGWRVTVAAATVGWLLVLLGRVPSWMGPVAPQFPEFYTYFLGMLVAHVAVLEVWRAGWLPPPLAALATLALLLTNVTYPHRSLAWTGSPPELAWQTNDLVRQVRTDPGRERVWNDGWLQRRGHDFEANAGLVHRVEIASHYTSLPTSRYNAFSRHVADPWRDAALVDLLNVRYLVLSERDTSPRGRGKYSPPRLEAGDERRYDLTNLLDGPIGEVTLAIERDPGVVVVDLPTLRVAPGRSLDVCLGCPPAAGSPPAAGIGGRTEGVSAALVPRQPATRLTLRNLLAYAVTVRELRLDEVDLYALGGRYRQLGPNLWENHNASPRAFLVEEVLVLPDTVRIVPLLQSLDPRHTAIVEKPLDCQRALRPSDGPPGEAVELLEYQPMLVRLRTRHPRPAFLVLTDMQYKDWRVSVDGRRASMHHVNLLFRGVCLPAGEHQVEFRYQPFAFQRGLLIAALAGLGAVTAVFIARRRPR